MASGVNLCMRSFTSLMCSLTWAPTHSNSCPIPHVHPAALMGCCYPATCFLDTSAQSYPQCFKDPIVLSHFFSVIPAPLPAPLPLCQFQHPRHLHGKLPLLPKHLLPQRAVAVCLALLYPLKLRGLQLSSSLFTVLLSLPPITTIKTFAVLCIFSSPCPSLVLLVFVLLCSTTLRSCQAVSTPHPQASL